MCGHALELHDIRLVHNSKLDGAHLLPCFGQIAHAVQHSSVLSFHDQP